MNLWLIFFTGLTSGGISCLAMQGGLLASIIANQKNSEILEKTEAASVRSEANSAHTMRSSRDWLPVALFLLTKLIAHAALGFLLGSVGAVLTLTLPVQLFFQVLAALFMLATAAHLLNLHPLFRYVAFQPPKFLQRRIHTAGKSSSLFAPAVLGFLTVFIPCGVTQAMEVSAITSGNPVQGVLIMTAFVLGTFPLFATVGIATSRLSQQWRSLFLRVAAVALIGLGLWGINGALVVMGSPITLQKIGTVFSEFGAPPGSVSSSAVEGGVLEDGVQKVTLTVSNSGYFPKNLTVHVGKPVELTLISDESYSCANAFTLREFGIRTMLKSTDRQSFTFTPTEIGEYTYTCSMGMYTGTLKVR